MVASLGISNAFRTLLSHADWWDRQKEVSHFSGPIGRFGHNVGMRMFGVQCEPPVVALCWLLPLGWCTYLTVGG